jgi:hypothetical protein
MNAYEKNLLNGIPQDEASSYFLRVTGRDKLASANLEEAWNELSSEEQDALLKEAAEAGLLEKDANAMMGAAKPGPPPAPAAMAAPSPQALPPTAQGMNSVKTAKERDPIETGKERAHTNLATNFEKHKHTKAERAGKHLGTVAGALGGAAAGKQVGGKPGAVTGAVLGALGGRSLGKDTGKSVDSALFSHRMKKKAEELKVAFDGSDGQMSAPSSGGPGLDPDGDPTLEEYLRQESMGQDAEEQAGASFYRQRLQQAMQELEATKAQADETSMKTQELEQQVSQNDQAVQAAMQQAQMAQQSAMANVQQAHEMAMQATSQAMESQAEVLRQKQLAAAMRMGVQTLKDNVMNAMAQDPTDQLAQQLQAPPPGSMGAPVGGQPPPPPAPIDPMTGQPMVDPAMAGQDPNAAAGGAPPAEGGGEKKPSSSEGGEKKEKSESKSEKKDDDKKDDGGKTHVEVKTGSAEERFLEALRSM